MAMRNSYEIIHRRTGNTRFATRSIHEAVNRYFDEEITGEDVVLVKFNWRGHAQTIIEPLKIEVLQSGDFRFRSTETVHDPARRVHKGMAGLVVGPEDMT